MSTGTTKPSTGAPRRDGGKSIGWGWALMAVAALAFVGGFDDPDYTLFENLAYSAILAGIGATLLIHGRRKRDLCVSCRRVDPQPVIFAHPSDYLCPLHASQRARIEAKEREVLEGTAGEGTDGAGMSAAAGWHPDPIVAGQLRYWDGNRWTEHTHPAAR